MALVAPEPRDTDEFAGLVAQAENALSYGSANTFFKTRKAVMVHMCSRRGLPVDGNKDVLASRLHAWVSLSLRWTSDG